MILVDTSVWIDFFRDSPVWEVERLAAAIEGTEDLCICGPVLMEIRQGIVSDKVRKTMERVLFPLVYLPTSRNTYCRAADLFLAARKTGKAIRSSMDCLIAACAIENNVHLLQRDKDYLALAEVSRLQLVSPDRP
jgi:predicted nucleic acid-binding protein